MITGSTFRKSLTALCAVLLLAASTAVAGPGGMNLGPVELKSVGPMTFATSGILPRRRSEIGNRLRDRHGRLG